MCIYGVCTPLEMIYYLIVLNLHLRTQCFPLPETWHLVHRNYAEDPAMGGDAKCVRGADTAPPENDSMPVLLQHSPNVSM